MHRPHRATKQTATAEPDGASEAQWLQDSLGHVRELSDRVTELSTLMGISTLLSSDRPLQETLEAVCRLSAEICRSQVAFLHLADGEEELVCVARHAPGDALQYAWEGVARIYGRKAIQKRGIVSCSNLLLRRETLPHDDGAQPRMGGICAIPLNGKTRVVGSMEIGYSGPHRFSAREKDMLSAIAAQVAMAVERSWLIDQLQEQLARADGLRAAGASILANLELEPLLESIVNHASRMLAAEFSGVFLLESSAGADAPRGEGRGRGRGQPGGAPLSLDDAPTGSAIRQAIETGRPAVVQSLQPPPSEEPLREPSTRDYRVALAVPLILDNEMLGVLVTAYLERRRFDPSDISLAEAFAHQAALAIRNARLYEQEMEARLALEAAFNGISNHGISLLDGDLNISFANPATFWLLGVGPKKGRVPAGEWIAHVKRGLIDGDQLDRVVDQLKADGGSTVVARLLARGNSDTQRTIRLLSLPLRQADGSLQGRVNILEEE